MALCIYRELGDSLGEVNRLMAIGWLRVSTGKHGRAEACLQQAVEISKKIGAPLVQADALCGLGRLYREYSGAFERARACGEEALRLSREVGAPFKEALGEANIGFAQHYLGDYSAAQPHMECFLQVADEEGEQGNRALGLVAMGLNSIALGDYSAALAHLEGSRCTLRELRMEDSDDDAWAQSTLALLYHQLGEDGTARGYAAHALAIHRKTGYDYRTATALTRLGHALTALGELPEAVAAYQEGYDMRRQMGQRHLAPEPLAGLARVALACDEAAAALTHVDEILSHLETGSLDGTDEPLRIYLTCYRVLRANGDPRAGEVLQSAHRLLQERAAKIDDEGLRRSYLENVPAHRELAREFRPLGPVRS